MPIQKRPNLKTWWRSGTPWIWMTGASVSASVLVVFALIAMIAARGMGHFWPSDVAELRYEEDGRTYTLIGEIVEQEWIPAYRYRELAPSDEYGQSAPDDAEIERILLKTGNRDHAPPDFRWIYRHRILSSEFPNELLHLERLEWGHAYGRLEALSEGSDVIGTGTEALPRLLASLQRADDLRAQMRGIESSDITRINNELESLRLSERRLTLEQPPDLDALLADVQQREAALHAQYEQVEARIAALRASLRRDALRLKLWDGQVVTVPIEQLVKVWQPNAMSLWSKLAFYAQAFADFLSGDPREANTEGGIYPAIFGTVVMVLLMSVMVTPLGVIAAIYLREYARQGVFVRMIRIAVNNLAGVPSIVYGVFGLGFFVYFVGSSVDQWFFPESLPTPTFGTPGLLWASLTLALLTVPVVIVSTEEGLSRIPRAIREGSLALGATKAETLFRVILPMASPSILTGVILAIARAAGEVAPLMLVGVVKLAPQLPIDGSFPFFHFERKFMHLGFHIYDVGFQSPNVEAARPIVYATAFLLVMIVLILNLTAIMLRGRLEKRYRAVE